MRPELISSKKPLNGATHEAIQLRAVVVAKSGMKATDLVKGYTVNCRTVFHWLANLDEGGEPALKAKPIPSRPEKLDESQMCWLAQAVTDQTPLEHRFKVGL